MITTRVRYLLQPTKQKTTEMQKKCKLCWGILGIFLVANLVLLSVWWLDSRESRKIEPGSYEKPDFHRQRMHDFLLREAGVDEVQFDEMYKLWDQHSQVMRESRIELDSLRKILMNETFSDNTGDDRVNSIVDEMTRVQHRIEILNYHHFKLMRQVCKNNAQRARFDHIFRTFIEKKPPHRRQRMGRSRFRQAY